LAIAQSFGFAGSEMASFYRSTPSWEQGEELPLLDMGIGEAPQGEKVIGSIFTSVENRILG